MGTDLRSRSSTCSGSGWVTIRALVGPPRVLLEACAELDVEGVAAKRVDSPTGRASDLATGSSSDARLEKQPRPTSPPSSAERTLRRANGGAANSCELLT